MPADQDKYSRGPQLADMLCRPSLIIADDLTGACDAAVAFTSACNPVLVHVVGQPSDSPCLAAITTESRNLPSSDAELRIRNFVERLPDQAQLFKKIDSVFRGNTANEVAAVLRSAHFDLAIITPAYPALGRTIQNGVLHIKDSSGVRTLAIGDLLAQVGCLLTQIPHRASTHDLAASLRSHVELGSRAILCDAVTQSDLLQVVRAARALQKRVLWIGSGGLAHALAFDLAVVPPAPPTLPRTGPTIFFIGSTHPVTCAQLDWLRNKAPIAEHDPSATRSPEEDLLIPVEFGKSTPEAIREAIASHAPAQTACLFMTGGDTAQFVCRALGIHSLRMLHEFAAGVPVGLAQGGPFDGVPVVLKSGGFGNPDLLCRLLEAHRAAPEVIA